MTGPEHYREAEDKLRKAYHIAQPGSGHSDEDAIRLVTIGLARAQVHATLALAAATALCQDGGHEAAVAQWMEAAS